MTIKIIHHWNGFVEVSGCPNCDDAPYLWFYKNNWVIDNDDGSHGKVARHCPMCGVCLPILYVETPDDNPPTEE